MVSGNPPVSKPTTVYAPTWLIKKATSRGINLSETFREALRAKVGGLESTQEEIQILQDRILDLRANLPDLDSLAEKWHVRWILVEEKATHDSERLECIQEDWDRVLSTARGVRITRDEYLAAYNQWVEGGRK